MNIKEIFNKLFKTNNITTDIINLNEIIKLPSRSDINSEEIISLINNYKKEYLSILSTKKYLLPKMLSSKNIQDELRNGRKGPHIRVDPDGVEVWDGKREEAIPITEGELEEMENLLKDFK